MSAEGYRSFYRSIANQCRAIPGEHGLRPWRVFLEPGQWSGSSHIGEGTESLTPLELLENGFPPKVRQVSSKMVALGIAEVGEWHIGPITPQAGTQWSDLLQQLLAYGRTFRIRLVNEEQGQNVDLVVKATNQDRALRFVFQAYPVR